MAMDISSIDHWRDYFRTASGDIFEVIENAIAVAALDFSDDFRIRRAGIGEKLFFCGYKSGTQVEALTVKIQEESRVVGEVLRIKELLSKSEDQSEEMIIESLWRLQLMSLSVETLQETKIGMTVNHLLKHKSKCISNFARAIVKVWKDLVDQWLSVVPDIKDDSPDSVNPSVVEEGFPYPPLEEGTFLYAQTTSIDLSRLSEDMDDDGNLRNCGEINMNRENDRNPTPPNQRIPIRKIQPTNEADIGTKESEGQYMGEKDSTNQQTNLSNTDVVPVRRPRTIRRPKVKDETKLQQELGAQNMSLFCQEDNSKCLDVEADQMKLEAAKRKLHKGDQQAENAKKQGRYR